MNNLNNPILSNPLNNSILMLEINSILILVNKFYPYPSDSILSY
jgi:hypothetical protein